MAELFQAFGIDWRLLLIQGVNFAILLGALWFLLYKPVLNILKDRERAIAKGVADAEAAEKARAEIESARSEKLKAAETEAAGIVQSAKTRGNAIKSELTKHAEERAQEIVEDAELRGTEIRNTAQKEAEKDIARLAILAAEKVLAKK